VIEIKKGALVKAWQNNPKVYVVGVYDECVQNGQLHMVSVKYDSSGYFNCIEIPADLAKQLEDLGR